MTKAATPAARAPAQPPSFSYAFTAFADLTPSSSRLVPFTTKNQLAVLTGGMAGFGVLFPRVLRVLGLVRFGYGAAGLQPGKGDDGLFLGGGVLVSLAVLPEVSVLERLEPFVRLHLDGRVAQTGNSPNGALGTNPFSVAVGVLAANGLAALHVAFGGDVAGGTSVGFGLSFGFMR